ncbi:MAG TPA: DUF4149 domain-containing protein [Blastocatellia bacterium]|nr:DUF4149 domain-containing protein [Blastocatellia bacterium]
MAVSTANSKSAALPIAARPGLAYQIAVFLEVLLLAVWLGSMMFFSFAVAPGAFAVLPSRELAGAMVTSSITKVETLGLIIGPLLILMQIVGWRTIRASSKIRSIRLALLGVMTLAAAASRFWISPAMVSLRKSLGVPIDDVALTDPLRVHFNQLHQYSVGAMSIALFAGLIVLFLTVRSWLKR